MRSRCTSGPDVAKPCFMSQNANTVLSRVLRHGCGTVGKGKRNSRKHCMLRTGQTAKELTRLFEFPFAYIIQVQPPLADKKLLRTSETKPSFFTLKGKPSDCPGQASGIPESAMHSAASLFPAVTEAFMVSITLRMACSTGDDAPRRLLCSHSRLNFKFAGLDADQYQAVLLSVGDNIHDGQKRTSAGTHNCSCNCVGECIDRCPAKSAVMPACYASPGKHQADA